MNLAGIRGLYSARELTATQADVLEFIMQEVERRRLPPTHREIAKRFKWKSNAAAKCHLIAIERKGYIRVIPMISRGLEILPKGWEWLPGRRAENSFDWLPGHTPQDTATPPSRVSP